MFPKLDMQFGMQFEKQPLTGLKLHGINKFHQKKIHKEKILEKLIPNFDFRRRLFRRKSGLAGLDAF